MRRQPFLLRGLSPGLYPPLLCLIFGREGHLACGKLHVGHGTRGHPGGTWPGTWHVRRARGVWQVAWKNTGGYKYASTYASKPLMMYPSIVSPPGSSLQKWAAFLLS